MPLRLPDPIAYLFDPHPILPENVTLDPEAPDMPEPGKVKVRALDAFLFVKDGRFVYPTYGVRNRWWEGVTAYGYTSALTGEFKYFIWAGQWNEDYYEKHLAVVVLANLQGLSKERSPHWRRGMEHILWLDTAQGYSYALLEPAEEYDRGGWKRVTDSWTNLPHPRSRRDPGFKPLQRQDPRPKWWIKGGDEAWDHWTGEAKVIFAKKQVSQSTLMRSKDQESRGDNPTREPKSAAGPNSFKRATLGTSSTSSQKQKQPIVVHSLSSDEEASTPSASLPPPTSSRASDPSTEKNKRRSQRPPILKPAAKAFEDLLAHTFGSAGFISDSEGDEVLSSLPPPPTSSSPTTSMEATEAPKRTGAKTTTERIELQASSADNDRTLATSGASH